MSEDLHRLTLLLTDQEFQELLKKRFSAASYTVSHSGERALLLPHVTEYLSALSVEDQPFVQTVLSRTLYVPDDVLTSELKRIVTEFLSSIGDQPFYIFLNRFKFASTELMIIKVMDLLVQANLLGFVTDESVLPEPSHVLIIDDASYSGTNLEAAIDSLSYINRPKNLKIHVLIPYISKFMYEALPKLYNVQMYSSNTMLTIDEYRVSQGETPFSDSVYERFGAIDKIEFHLQLPLYFDHTVASKDSSFPTIYLQGVIPEDGYYGKLIPYCPDQEIRHHVYYTYFDGLLPTPMPLKGDCK